MTPVPAAAAKSIKTAVEQESNFLKVPSLALKELINLIELDSYKQRAAATAENIKLAGESL